MEAGERTYSTIIQPNGSYMIYKILIPILISMTMNMAYAEEKEEEEINEPDCEMTRGDDFE